MKKVIIYGIGSGCNRVLHHLKEDVIIVAYTDSYQAGQLYKGMKVLPPLHAVQLDYDYILVASSAFSEISKQLVTLGVEEFKILPAVDFVMHNNIPEELYKTTITGLSYAKGILSHQLAQPAANLAAPSQDLFMDYCWLESYLDRCKEYNFKPKTAVIGLAYYSFDYDLFKSNFINQPSRSLVGLYSRLNLIRDKIKEHSLDRFILADQHCETFMREIHELKSLFQLKEVDDTSCFRVGQNLEIAREELGRRHSNRSYKETVEENIEILSKYLSLLSENEIKPIVIISPQLKEYRIGFGDKKADEFKNIVWGIQQQFDFQMIDLYDSSDFNYNYFADYDHLNTNGYLKLTNILNEVIALK
ncbi:nucleoside-diphosphate sugar epimerase/dehydratase [Cohnella herbarum]|uniref:Uncharacterized protein n=1 Tax=Cohnella herbarum TaxID=2728023 RepID=A0A7Z2VLC0_9BACL|nr:D-alanyl-lipoteichoic acid biosynthesis protein DltD [Cohnella herbarum]QJD85198.1 hypothetical protein HH215_19810 [Cohnella herbarum]